jgi:hypothetical protein
MAAAWRERVFDPLRAQHKAIFTRAVRRGEIPATTDTDTVLDLVFGAAYHRLLHQHLPLSDRFVRDAVDLVMDGVRPKLPGREALPQEMVELERAAR